MGLAMIIITAVLCAAFSFQMAINDIALWNAILVLIEFAFVRAFYYIYKAMYYYEHFPPEHFSALYLCNTILCGFGNFVTGPIFTNFISNGDDLADANFSSVSMVLAAFFHNIKCFIYFISLLPFIAS